MRVGKFLSPAPATVRAERTVALLAARRWPCAVSGRSYAATQRFDPTSHYHLAMLAGAWRQSTVKQHPSTELHGHHRTKVDRADSRAQCRNFGGIWQCHVRFLQNSELTGRWSP